MHISRLFIVLFSLLAGCLFFTWYHGWVLFNFPASRTSTERAFGQSGMQKKQVTLWYWKADRLKHETSEILWSDNQDSTNLAKNTYNLVTRWLTFLHEENILDKQVALQAIALSPSKQETFLSFDHGLFQEENSTYNKLMLLESLLKTIKENGLPDKSLRFLVHHQPLQDVHLDFSQSWPIDGFTAQHKTHANIKQELKPAHPAAFTIMLDPAGDAQHAGRIIDNNFERGLTLQCAHELKQLLEKMLPHVRVIISRIPGETVEPLHSAAFANRLNADLVVTLNFYHAASELSPLYIYYILQNPTDFWATQNTTTLHLEPYHQAHRKNLATSHALCSLFERTLKPLQGTSRFIAHGPYGIPFKPLIGMQAPACAIEAGLANKDSWHKLVKPIAEAINSIVHELQAR